MISLLKMLVSHMRFSVASRIGHGVIAILVVAALAQPSFAELIYGIANVSPANALLSWDSAAPENILSGSFISGLEPSESVLGIDFRPSTGELFALGSTGESYTINRSSGIATRITGSFVSPSLSGFSFGYDFNPVTDRIRVVSEANQNLVLNPNTGLVQSAGPNLFYAAGDPHAGVDPNVVDAAYSNNFPGAPTTQLYGIDTALDILVLQNPTTGALTTVGNLGLNATAAGGFDISPSGWAYAVLLPAGSSQSSLYTINLNFGFATPVGQIDGGVVITAMSVLPVPEPTTFGLTLFAAVACQAIRRRRR
jgi:hypothetical protein